MILFVSDAHFGKEDGVSDRLVEAELLDCLRAHEARVERLYLVGDLFDQYIEYRYLVPKGFVRFQALLAAWAERGVPVTYLAGNHDPWHRDYFAQELGVRVVLEHVEDVLYGRRVHVAHGDGLASSTRLYNRLKPWLRHPACVWLYRTVLPADLGMGLARRVSRAMGGRPPDPVTVRELAAHARALLRTARVDAVVMGHSHVPDVWRGPEGVYLNLGAWRYDRTFGALDAQGLRLLCWNGTCSEEVDPHTYARLA